MSLTEINAIDENYPVAGIDQSSQTFRDNFDNIKVALTDLDTLVVNVINDLTDVDTLSTPPVNDDVLVFNGADWVPGFSKVVLDTAPQLGGNLDVNGFHIGDGALPALDFTLSATPVNYFVVGNADTGASPSLASFGTDVDVNLILKTKGDGSVVIDSDSITSRIEASAGHSLDVLTPNNAAGNGFDFNLRAGSSTGAGGRGGNIEFRAGAPDGAGVEGTTRIRASDNGTIARFRGTSSGGGVNFLAFRNNITGFGPTIEAVGADTNINLNINAFGPTGRVRISGLNYPNADGLSAGSVLKTNGSGFLAFSSPTDLGEFLTANLPNPTLRANSYALATDWPVTGRTVVRSNGTTWQAIADEGLPGGGLLDVVDDTTPQLGGNLDVNGFDIVSVSNGDITVTPDGSGSVILDGLTYPSADGSGGDFLITNGGGVLSFTAPPDPTVWTFRLDPTSSPTILPTDGIVVFTFAGFPSPVSLPPAGAVPPGKQFILKNGPGASGSVITPAGPDTIDGTPGTNSVLLGPTFAFVTLVSDGATDWSVVSN